MPIPELTVYYEPEDPWTLIGKKVVVFEHYKDTPSYYILRDIQGDFFIVNYMAGNYPVPPLSRMTVRCMSEYIPKSHKKSSLSSKAESIKFINPETEK